MIYNYSIIIPHKNTPSLLQKCLDSIPQRSDVQVIVVDDNSDPAKVDFEHFPSWSGEHFELYLTKEGRGAGFARNVGLEHACGRWLLFADADDFFHPALNNLLDECLDLNVDVVCFKSDSINLNTGEDAHRSDGFNERVDIAMKTGDFQPMLMYSCPHRKIYRHQLIIDNKILFNEVPCANDAVFMAKIAYACKSCKAIDINAYCVTDNSFSIMSRTKRNPRSMEIRVTQDIEAAEYYKKAFDLTCVDRYWFFVTWYNLYTLSKVVSAKYIYPMCRIIGYKTFFSLYASKLKKKMKSIVK